MAASRTAMKRTIGMRHCGLMERGEAPWGRHCRVPSRQQRNPFAPRSVVGSGPRRHPMHRFSSSILVVPKAVPSVSERMQELKEEGRCALIPFIVAGDPDMKTTPKALQMLSDGGADVIELGVPYSDPLADGPTIQAAATRALEKRVTLDDVLKMLAEVSPGLKSPVVLFTYFNPILKKGIDQFCKEAKAAGASGLLVPDLPLEETPPIREGCEAHGLELVMLVTPTTPKERMGTIANASQGFVYLVSLAGVTGTRATVADNVQELLSDLQSSTDKSVAVGFGVSGSEQAKLIKSWGAEGVIVGSALVKQLGESGSPEQGLESMGALLKELREAL